MDEQEKTMLTFPCYDLDYGGRVRTEMNCTVSGSNDTWLHGQSWMADKCTRCVCNAPLVQCTRIICSISCRKPLLYVEDECCPICPPDEGNHHLLLCRRSFPTSMSSVCLSAGLILVCLSLSLSVLQMRHFRVGTKSKGERVAERNTRRNQLLTVTTVSW